MYNHEWAAFVRTNRKRLGFNLRKLAFLAGIDASYVTLIERDGYVPKRDKVVAIARALETDIDRTLLEAGYAPESIPISTIMGKTSVEAARDVLIPELSQCLHELAALSQVQQIKVADFLSTFICTLRFREREKQHYTHIAKKRSLDA
ncbi:MAG: helix-turn-helix transcriptional regulator [bacterium]|nr:helix-turn-helix transcriptional regulator [bacterium]